MEWVALALLAVAVVAMTVLVATGRVAPALLAEPTRTVPPLELPDTPTSSDVDRLSLGTTVYGYAAEDVDAALDARRQRLADQELALGDGHQALAEPRQDSAGERTSASERDGHVHPHA